MKKSAKQWTDAERRKLTTLAKRGADAAEISASLSRYTASVKREARKMGILLRKRARAAN